MSPLNIIERQARKATQLKAGSHLHRFLYDFVLIIARSLTDVISDVLDLADNEELHVSLIRFVCAHILKSHAAWNTACTAYVEPNVTTQLVSGALLRALKYSPESLVSITRR
jgi:hypothetical protein